MAAPTSAKMEHNKRVDVDAAELSNEEWFFLRAVLGLRPGASLEQISEFQKGAFAMPRKQQLDLISAGMQSLMARGFIAFDTDENGAIRAHENGNPMFKVMGNIVSRVRHVDTKSFQ